MCGRRRDVLWVGDSCQWGERNNSILTFQSSGFLDWCFPSWNHLDDLVSFFWETPLLPVKSWISWYEPRGLRSYSRNRIWWSNSNELPSETTKDHFFPQCFSNQRVAVMLVLYGSQTSGHLKLGKLIRTTKYTPKIFSGALRRARPISFWRARESCCWGTLDRLQSARSIKGLWQVYFPSMPAWSRHNSVAWWHCFFRVTLGQHLEGKLVIENIFVCSRRKSDVVICTNFRLWFLSSFLERGWAAHCICGWQPAIEHHFFEFCRYSATWAT